MRVSVPWFRLSLVVLALFGSACRGERVQEADGELPLVMVTTTILGDVVHHLVGERARVEVLMPPGGDPHEFEPSARQVELVTQADIVIANGLGFEEGLVDTLEAARDDGVAVYEVAPDLDPLTLKGEGEDEDEEGRSHKHHEGEGFDPHVWTDPRRMAKAVDTIAAQLAKADPALGSAVVTARAESYAQELRELDAEIERLLASVPETNRELVTNHEVFGYFAQRYGFELVGTVIPSSSTLAEPSSKELDRLATIIEDRKVKAVFAETTQPAKLAETIAAAVNREVEVVRLFTESLGKKGSGAETYVDMMRTNATRIAEALA